MTSTIDCGKIIEFVKDRAHSSEFREFMTNLAKDMIDIDNTPTQSLARIVENEQKVFRVLQDSINSFTGPETTIEKAPINTKIQDHPYYTRAYYTADEKHPMGLSAQQVYKDRFNLFAIAKPKQTSISGCPVILNAHVDTVAPFFPCKIDDKYIHGRGACDDKGLVVMLAASMKLFEQVQAKFGPIPSRDRVYQFVTEEETGGNGSLSASMDSRFKGHEVIVCEATSQIPHPANRGAMWFKLRIDTSSAGLNALPIVPFIIVELGKEGQKLREETNQPLFPKDYVQVNLGTLNSFGKHPSAVNDYLSFEMTIQHEGTTGQLAASRINNIINSAVEQYCLTYPDRTRKIDPETNKPELKKHYKLTRLEESSRIVRYKLEIFGLGGHMSALLLRDNALTKVGYILSALICAYSNLPGTQFDIRTTEQNFNPEKLTMTGGVGFTPAHRMINLRERLRETINKGIKRYNESVNQNVSTQIFDMTFDMLHNEAYASPLDCPSMNAFKWAYKQQGLTWPKPKAFRASCDARIYGNNEQNTITFGPGDLKDAHSDHEKLSINQLQTGLELITFATLALTSGEIYQAT